LLAAGHVHDPQHAKVSWFDPSTGIDTLSPTRGDSWKASSSTSLASSIERALGGSELLPAGQSALALISDKPNVPQESGR
jgi:hypothetical protein